MNLARLGSDRKILSRLDIAPDRQVVLHRLHACEDDRPLALTVAAGAAEQTLKVGVVLSRTAVMEYTHVRIVHGLGRVEHVLQEDKGRNRRLHLQRRVDILSSRGDGASFLAPSSTAACRIALRIPLNDLAARRGGLQPALDVRSLRAGRAEDVVEGSTLILTVDHRDKVLDVLLGTQGEGLVDALLLKELLDRLVLALAGAELDQAREGLVTLLGHTDCNSRVGSADRHEADVVIRPGIRRTEIHQSLEENLRRSVVTPTGEMRLVQYDQYVFETTLTGRHTTQRSLYGAEATVVRDVVAHRLRKTLLSLLKPGVVAHAGNHKHAVRRNAHAATILRVEHKTDKCRDDTRLTRLHLCSQMDPGLVRPTK